MKCFLFILLLLNLLSTSPASASKLTDLNRDGRISAADIIIYTGSSGTRLSALVELPDTIAVRATPAEPGGLLQVDVEVSFRSKPASGFLLVLSGIPEVFTGTVGVDITDGGSPPIEAGTWYYKWSPFGAAIINQAIDSGILFDESKHLSIYTMGANIDILAMIPESLGGIGASKSGTIATLYFNVPKNMEEGTHRLAVTEGGDVMVQHPLSAGIFDGTPTVFLDDWIIREEPEYHRGDVNRDGKVDIMDVLEVLMILRNL